jgi:hypothetical protein
MMALLMPARRAGAAENRSARSVAAGVTRPPEFEGTA